MKQKQMTAEQREERIKKMESVGWIAPDCEACRPVYEDPEAKEPMVHHRPSRCCRVGGVRPHCTCRACF